MENKKETEKRERNFLQRIAFKIAQFLKLILRVVFYNPIPWVILTAIVFGRFYELGYLGIKGSTVLVSGVCKNYDGYPRTDMAQDQIVVSAIVDNNLEGIIRRTREYVSCPLDRVSIDRVGTIKDLFKWDSLIPLPEIAKQNIKKYTKQDYSIYLNKDILVSGTCMDAKTNKTLDPFIGKRMSVTNIKESKELENVVYFYGVRDDNVAMVCDSQDITYKLVSSDRMAQKDQMQIDEGMQEISYVGEKVFLTAFCLPDYKLFRLIGKKPSLSNYNLQKTPVEVVENVIDADGKVVSLRASILAKQVVKNGKVIPILGDKITCEAKNYPIILVPASDPSVQIEKEKAAQ